MCTNSCTVWVCVHMYLLFVCVHYSVFAFVCVLVCTVCYSFIVQFCFVYTICCVVYAYTICMFALLRVNKCMCVCVHEPVCVYWMRLAWDPDGPVLGKEREGVREARIKNERVQSSEADDCVFVRVNLFITDAREISIEMILVTDSPWISPMADTQMFMFTELERESRKGQWCEEEWRGERANAVWEDNKRGKIRVE